MIWLSPSEIAEAAKTGLMPGLPGTKRGVNALAAREGWRAGRLMRDRAGAEGGGGVEYHIDCLPSAARLGWLRSQISIVEGDIRPALSDDPLDLQSDAIDSILRIHGKLRAASGLSFGATDDLFAELYADPEFAVPVWVRTQVKTVSPRTLKRWRGAAAKGKTVAARGRKARSGVLDCAHSGEVRSYILAAVAAQPFLDAEHLRAMVAQKFGASLDVIEEATGVVNERPLPSIRTFQRTVTSWKERYRNELMRLSDPDRYRSHVEFVATGTQTAERLNQIWQIDASPADVMLTEGRHSIYMLVDIYSRRSLILVSKTPRAAAVGLLLRKALLDWGVPELIYTDNGSDFVARATNRLLAALDIEVELSPPYEPRHKGIVERCIGTFQRDAAVLPGFIGHSVADRKVLENRKAFDKRLGLSDMELFDVKMDLPAFQGWCDSWAHDIYGTTPHGGLNGVQPNIQAAQYAGLVRRIESVAALDVLLAPVPGKDGLRKVTKSGIRIEGAQYLPLKGALPGQSVLVRMDPTDAGRVMVFDPQTDAFLTEAICAQLAGLNPAEIVARARAMQKNQEAEIIDPIRKQMRKITPYEAANALRLAGEDRASQVVAFPQPTVNHETPALSAAGEAAGVVSKAVDATEGDFAANVTSLPVLPSMQDAESPQDLRTARLARAADIEARRRDGLEISARDHTWLQNYMQLPEYRAALKMRTGFAAEGS